MDLDTITAVLRPRRLDELPAWGTGDPWRAGDAWLAGGTWLFSEPQPALDRLIDLTALGWPAAEISGAGLRLSATGTIAELDRLALPKDWIAAPLVGQCCRALLGSFKIWNRASVGGNLCLALPAGPMIALTAALDGICVVHRPRGAERRLLVTDFVLGPQRTALEPGEILRCIELPAAALRRRTAFRRIALSPGGRSGALVIGTRERDGGFALIVTAATPRPVRLPFPALPTAAALQEAIASAIPAAGWYDDVHGAPDWRRHVTGLLAEEIREELAR